MVEDLMYQRARLEVKAVRVSKKPVRWSQHVSKSPASLVGCTGDLTLSRRQCRATERAEAKG